MVDEIREGWHPVRSHPFVPRPAKRRLGVCIKCYGRDLARGTPSTRARLLAVSPRSRLASPGTQLTMRTFHMAVQRRWWDSSFLEASFEGKVQNPQPFDCSQLGRQPRCHWSATWSIAIVDASGKGRSAHRITYGSRVLVDDGDTVRRGQRLAEWDPYTRPFMTEVEGTVAFEDMVDSISVSETTDESTGITKRVVIDWRSNDAARC